MPRNTHWYTSQASSKSDEYVTGLNSTTAEGEFVGGTDAVAMDVLLGPSLSLGKMVLHLQEQNIEPQNPILNFDSLLCEEDRIDEGDLGGGYHSDERNQNGVIENVKKISPFNIIKKSLEWMLTVIDHYGFNALIVVLAVNYFDRFISGVSFQKVKPWMSQLVAVACLSIAAKVEEIQGPLLLDLQVSNPKYVFEAKTIQKIELLVLSTLKWKMNPVTPLSFIDHIIKRFGLMTNLCSEFQGKCENIILGIITGEISI
ncbi:cyclin-D3-2-like [Solanum tuberosum]|uniref:cyclin-D3-2-like n=1 Tax=Solanum tuberosum TaxID=4113 RepID=UPI000739FB3E|nr:PREDICTED: cyclin-D3-2-like [Solanum tuberosum]